MKKILIPVDFSENSDNACQYALRMASVLKARIRLVHYFSDLLVDSEMPPVNELNVSQRIAEEILHETDRKAKTDLEELHMKLNDQIERELLQGIKIGHSFIWGNPEDGIIETCENDPQDIIIMGTSGEGDKLFMGSVTLKVIEKSPSPVLAIPLESRFREIRRIVYATDFGEADYGAIEKLLYLFKIFRITVSCVHVADKSTPDKMKQMDKFKSQCLRKFPKASIQYELIENNSIPVGLEDYIKAEGIDIIAVTKHQRNIFEKIFNPSITKKMLFHTHIPLLAFHM